MQIPEFNPDTHVPVMEHFYTLQGEGAHQGKAAYFIRLAGCDVGCVWCDVKASWAIDEKQIVSINEIADHAASYPGKMTVITGGEPLMHNCAPLTSHLKKRGFTTHMETSGAHPLSGSWDWVCLSPKKFKNPLPEIYANADELKIIVYNRSDFAWAEQQARQVGKKCKLFLQPEWSREKEMMPLIVSYIKEHPEWQVSLQTHKYLDIP